MRKLVFTTEPGIEVPALLFTPEKADAAAPLTVVVGYDKTEAIGPEGPVEGLLKKGTPCAGRRPARDGRDGARGAAGPARSAPT